MTSRTAFVVAHSPRNFDDEAGRYLREQGCLPLAVPLPADQNDGSLGEDALAAALAEADAWIVGHARVTRSLLERLPRLQAVCRRGVGYERVDTQAVQDLGKVAAIAAGGNDASVADHVVGLMLAVSHRMHEGRQRLERGDWSIPVGLDLYRKTVGIIGLGRIGRGVAERLAGFRCRILASGRAGAAADTPGIEHVPLDKLLADSDYVSVHAPLTPATRHLIGAAALARMKPSAILINTARGGLVDDAALLQALQQGRLGGAGLDVFESESDAQRGATTAALLQLPNVVATPHSAGSTVESLQRTNLVAAACAVAVLQGRDAPAGCIVADGRQSR